ncbi:MAG: iron chelate uptake ABC transporter family permease subunit [candidate division Zixibacteria bacterium]|nr:iron chelate uptake ABC transporter family permease subunit [candidate division Zixibacteria bacterium]
MNTPVRRLLVFLAMVLALAGVCVVSMGIGAVELSAGTVLRVLLAHLPYPFTLETTIDPTSDAIVWDIRLPRTLLAMLVGMALAASGGIMQGFFQNPMADPYVVGVSAGAALGATSAYALGLDFWVFGINAVSVSALLCAVGITLLVYLLSRRRGRVASGTLLLTGIAVGSLATSITSFLLVMGQEDQRRVLFWLMGSLSSRQWDHVVMLFPYVIIGLSAAMLFARDLNALLLGDEQAAHLGIAVERVKLILLAAASCLAAAAVSVSGIIGFVGLLVPHVVRLAAGPDYRFLMPLSTLGGGILLVLADTVARTALAPAEMPVGILTTLLGGPFFLYLLYRQKNRLF